MKILLIWFKINLLKPNLGKFQFIVLGVKTFCKQALVKNSKFVEASDDVILLGITTDKKLTLSKHIDNLCRNAQYKLRKLRRIRKFFTVEKATLLVNSPIDNQFTHAPLIWMFTLK